MDRIKFSSLLAQQREENNIGKNAMCRLTGFSFLQLQLIENACNNYNMKLVFRYLSAIWAGIILQKRNKELILVEYSQLIEWLISARKKNYTQQQLADDIDISRGMLMRIESQKSNLSVDIFLKIVDVLGYKIDIQSI